MNLFFRADNSLRWPVIITLIIVFVVIGIAVNQFIYDDWRCMFAECRIVKERP